MDLTGVAVNGKYDWTAGAWMEFVAVGLCTRKWLRLYQNIGDLASGDLRNPLVVIRLGVTGLKKTRIVYLLSLFEGKGEKRQCDLACVERLNGSYVDVLLKCVGECGCTSVGSWSFSKEWLWRLGTKGMLHCFREVKCQQDDTSGN